MVEFDLYPTKIDGEAFMNGKAFLYGPGRGNDPGFCILGRIQRSTLLQEPGATPGKTVVGRERVL